MPNSKLLLKIIIFCCLFFVSFSSVFAQVVVINEVLVDPNPEFVEFYNASDSANYLKDYWIDDDQSFRDDIGNANKKSLSLLDVSDPRYPFFELNSFFNNDGDWVVLFDPQGNVVDEYQYDKSYDGVSFGRYPDGSGLFDFLSSITKGFPNSEAKATPKPTASPIATPLSIQTPTSTPEPALTPSPEPKVVPSLKPTEIAKSNEEDLEKKRVILGESKPFTETPYVEEIQKFSDKRKVPFLALAFLVIGFGFMSISFYPLVREMIKKYNKNRDLSEKSEDNFLN